jgi:hypothetical protein
MTGTTRTEVIDVVGCPTCGAEPGEPAGESGDVTDAGAGSAATPSAGDAKSKQELEAYRAFFGPCSDAEAIAEIRRINATAAAVERMEAFE